MGWDKILKHTMGPSKEYEYTYKAGDKLFQHEENFIGKAQAEGLADCPDCKVGFLREGPHGGGSINYYCDNPDCGSGFNEMGPFGYERITDRSPKR